MKLALSNSDYQSDPAGLVERCRVWGCHGVEWDHSSVSPIEAGRIFSDAGVQIVCVNASARFTEDSASDTQAAETLRAAFDSARSWGCHLVKISDPLPRRRESIMATISAMSDWLLPLADRAANQGITILVEAGPALSTARALWMLMERAGHSAIGISWNIPITLAAGEPVAVTIPTLNMRIRYVQMGDANPTEPLTRLRGIGYTGWIAFKGAENPPEGASALLVGSQPLPGINGH